MKKLSILFFMLVFLVIIAHSAHAHVPYVEHFNFSDVFPFIIWDSVENSKAIYAFLENEQDYDVYTFEVTEQVRVFTSAVVPICPWWYV